MDMGEASSSGNALTLLSDSLHALNGSLPDDSLAAVSDNLKVVADSLSVVLESDIALWELAAASGAVFIAAAVSMFFNLRMHTQLLLQAGRMVLQLTILGIILVPVIEYARWWLVLIVTLAMLLISGIEAVSRPGHTYKGMLLVTLLSIALGVVVTLALAVPSLLRVHPLLSAQVFIPVLGALLDAAVTGASAGLACILQEMASGHTNVELMLTQGASRWEATQWIVCSALTAAMSPVLTHLGVVGLVTIPGLMSGMVLQGADPIQASRLQACLVLLVVGTTSVSSVACVLLTVHHLVDEEHMIRMDRLRTRAHGGGIGFYMRAKLIRATVVTQRMALRIGISCCGLRVSHVGTRGPDWLYRLLGIMDINRDRGGRPYRLSTIGGPAGSEDFDDLLSWDGTETSDGN